MKPRLDQRGAALVSTLVVMVVVTLVIFGMMQLALASYRVGRFEEDRQRALAAAESGIAVAVARLAAGESIPRATYPSPTPSIDSDSAHWAGPGTGPLPPDLALGPRASFRVWVSEPTGGKTTLVAAGRCGTTTRVVQVTVTEASSASALKFLIAATSDQEGSISLTGSATLDGDIYTAAKSREAIRVTGSVNADGRVYVSPDADIAGIREELKRFYSPDEVMVDTGVYSYPSPVLPVDLPWRGALKLTGSGSVTIRDSGQYDSVKVTGSGTIKIDTSKHDVVFRVTGEFDVAGSATIRVTGPHAFKLYVERDVKGTGSGVVETGGDPTKFIIYCLGRQVRYSGSSSTTAVVYAPDAAVDMSGSGPFTGAIVAKTVTSTGSARLSYPSEYADELRELDLGPVEGSSSLEIASWRERNPV